MAGTHKCWWNLMMSMQILIIFERWWWLGRFLKARRISPWSSRRANISLLVLPGKVVEQIILGITTKQGRTRQTYEGQEGDWEKSLCSNEPSDLVGSWALMSGMMAPVVFNLSLMTWTMGCAPSANLQRIRNVQEELMHHLVVLPFRGTSTGWGSRECSGTL